MRAPWKEPATYQEYIGGIARSIMGDASGAAYQVHLAALEKALWHPKVMEGALRRLGRFDSTYYLYLARKSQAVYAKAQGRVPAASSVPSGTERSLETARALHHDLELFRTYTGELLTNYPVTGNLLDSSGDPGETRLAILAELLWSSPRLQSRLATLINATPSRWLLQEEIEHIRARRAVVPGAQSPTTSGAIDEDSFACAFREGFTGLAFSGGGIRSATFNLGVLQAFAESGMLPRFDYLASVSSGGYIHQWFAAWLLRTTKLYGDPRRAFRFLENALTTQPNRGSTSVSPPEIGFLRRYGNYLTPRVGLFTLDTWTMLATWVRNTFLNQLIIAGLLIAAIAIARLILLGFVAELEHPAVVLGTCWVACAALVLAAWWLIAGRLRAVQTEAALTWWLRPQALRLGIWLFVFASWVWTFVILHTSASRPEYFCATALFALIGFLLIWASQTVPRFYRKRAQEKQESQWQCTLYTLLYCIFLVAAAVGISLLGAGLLWGWHDLVRHGEHLRGPGPLSFASSFRLAALLPAVQAAAAPAWLKTAELSLFQHRDEIMVLFGFIVFLKTLFLAILLCHGLTGDNIDIWRREWMTRLRAVFSLISAAWAGTIALVLLGPHLLGFAVHSWAAILAWAWGLLSGAGLLAGNSGKVSGAKSDTFSLAKFSLNTLAVAGGYAFVVGFLVLLSGFVDWAAFPAKHPIPRLWIVLAVSAFVGLLYGWRLNINEFSMHAFYRNRLGRCYLGASTQSRKPDPFTGMDPQDGKINLSELLPGPTYPGPFPIFCATVNISIGADLGWQAGAESGDLQSSTKLHPKFPNDPTANQWFNESKFESYRLLGRSIALRAR